MNTARWMDNGYAIIDVKEGSRDGVRGFGPSLTAKIELCAGQSLRTKSGRRRLRRVINTLTKIAYYYELRYGDLDV